MKIGDKFGQFYMVATMVIIVLIASFAIVINYSSQRIPPSFYYLGEEIEIESEKVIEYGLNNELDLNVLLEAAKFRHDNYNRKLSYIDCIGYLVAIKSNLKFLTGDRQFENRTNVEFVK